MTIPWLKPDEVQNYGLWLQSGAIFFSLMGVIIATRANRKIARRRATLDLIMTLQSNEFLVKQRQEFNALRDAGNIVQWAALDKASSPEQSTLRATMNRYELIAIGIKEKTIDGRVYKRYARSGVIQDWCACKPWVMQMRQNHSKPVYYCEVEALAKKWSTKAERDHC